MASNLEESIQTIEDFLNSLGLQEYSSTMEEEGIDLDSLTEFTEEDLKEIGIVKIGHRKKILKNIKRILGTDVNVIENIPSRAEERSSVSSVKASKGNGTEELGKYGRDKEIRIAILGKTGVGKSATANTILGEKMFTSKPLFASVTSKCAQASRFRFNKKIVIVDTPGVCDTKKKDEEIQKEILQCLAITAPGPHAFILVLKIGRYTDEEHKAVKHFITNFGENIYEYFIVIFTGKDELDRAGSSLQESIENAPENLKEFIKRCQNRVLAFNNTLEGTDQEMQVQELLEIINTNIVRNGGKFYTNKMYEEAEKVVRKRQKEIEEREKEKWEEERRKMEEAVAEKFKADMKTRSEEDTENVKKQMQKELEEMRRVYAEKIDSYTRDEVRKEAEENQGFMSKLRNGVTWAWNAASSWFSS